MDVEVNRCRNAISIAENEKKLQRSELNVELWTRQGKTNDLEVRLQESEHHRIMEEALDIADLEGLEASAVGSGQIKGPTLVEDAPTNPAPDDT
ncbi:hypothetical protein U1Q18_013676 [Sarracenia purpurea var. burkii]